MKKIKKIIDTFVEWVCMAMLSMMVILVTYQVITRYFFNQPSSFSEVLAKYIFVWMVMFGGAYVFGLREHMNVGFIRDKMPKKIRISVEILGEAVIMLFALGVMVIGGFQGAMKQMIQLDSSLQIPVGFIYAIIPISGALIIFYFFCNVITLAKKYSEEDDEITQQPPAKKEE